MTTERFFVFPMALWGEGSDAETAWENACESFALNDARDFAPDEYREYTSEDEREEVENEIVVHVERSERDGAFVVNIETFENGITESRANAKGPFPMRIYLNDEILWDNS